MENAVLHALYEDDLIKPFDSVTIPITCGRVSPCVWRRQVRKKRDVAAFLGRFNMNNIGSRSSRALTRLAGTFTVNSRR